MSLFGKIFSNEKFDAIIVLGDRYEIYSAVISASFYKIPIIHLSGGETTLGVIDEPIRHSITKFSNFHLLILIMNYTGSKFLEITIFKIFQEH